jgi:hypothetical protein
MVIISVCGFALRAIKQTISKDTEQIVQLSRKIFSVNRKLKILRLKLRNIESEIDKHKDQ